jgi:hypothetical protein
MKISALGVALSLALGQLSAATLYSNLGSGDSYSSGAWSTTSSGSFSDGTVFTAAGTGALATVFVPIADANGSLAFDLYADSAGHPGTLLEHWSSVTVPTSLVSIPLLSLASVANPVLSSGSIYWFVATSAATSTGLTWDQSNQLSTGGIWVGSGTSLTQVGATFPPPAIKLVSAAVPEPTTWVLLAAPLAAMLWFRRQSHAKPNRK